METRSEPGQTDMAPAAMPSAVRRALVAGLCIAMLGALYLMAVRGEALLVDLQALSRIFCF
jgi:hypothetical protein